MEDICFIISTDKEFSGIINIFFFQVTKQKRFLFILLNSTCIHLSLGSEDQARVYAAEIVSAVSHLHKNGIVHRDLKPENILMDADGHV